MEKTLSFAARCLILILLSAHTAFGQNADIEVLRAIHVGRNTSYDGVLDGFSKSTYPVALTLPAVQLIYGFSKGDKQSIHNGVQTIGALGASAVITYGLKYIVRRDRPYQTYNDVLPYHYDTDPSFPSGHSTIALATATTLSFEYPKWYVIVPAWLWAMTIEYSRLHLGQHYPSDVWVGGVIGVGSAVLSYKAGQWLRRKYDPAFEKGVKKDEAKPYTIE